MIMSTLIALLVTACISLVAYGASTLIKSREEQTGLRAKMSQDNMPLPSSVTPSPALGLKGYISMIAHAVGDRFKPRDREELTRMEATFLNAGLRKKNVVVLFFGTKVMCAALFLLCFMLFRLLTGIQIGFTGTLLLASLSTLIGFYGPNFWLKGKITRRREQIIRGFPDALDLMVVCTEAGMSLDAALKRVGEEMRLSNETLSEEFKILNLELRAGKSKAEVLRGLGKRIGLEDVNTLMTLLIQTEKFGTSVGQALRVHSDAMRTTRIQRVEEVAGKLPIKLLFPTIFCVFPSIFLVVLGPAIITAIRTWQG
jgi:tight adherence protein C